MDQTQTPSEHPKLDALIAGYLEAVERGEAPARDQIIADNPDLATELRAFFDDLDRVQRAAASPNDGPTPNKPDAAHASTVIRPNHEPTPGVIIAGRYKLLENIGEGGMGSVWVAEQLKPVKRKVAIKLIKPGMDSKQVLARFEAERQALAVMDHPNIAKVFDGGLTEQSRPYFVMEYVKGVPFTDYCDRARLPLKDRLSLFIAVCSAVQHAHQKGIVHRDLKPSNILICLYDGHPVPKVIDFGLAKAMHQPLTEQSIFTGHGVMVGTPLYMSPEQAESNNLDIDTRTDIYSLGVVLYELLTGSTPLERQQLQKAAFDEVLRLIKEVEPPRPSLRLSGSDSLASIAAQRSIDPKQLSRSLSGDLDWIAMKALDKERSRRYETANGLARDIERFLNEEPVEACPPSTAYRVRKFIKRYKAQVTAATIVLLALIAGIVGTSWGLRKARIAEEKAVASEGKTMQALADVTKERDAKEQQRVLAEDRATQLQRQSYRMSLQAAYRTIEAGELDAARKILDEIPESQRGWEWKYLVTESDVSLGSVSIPPKTTIRAHASNGTYVLLEHAGKPNGPFSLMRSIDGKIVTEVTPPTCEETVSVKVSDDAKRIAFLCVDKLLSDQPIATTIHVWDQKAREFVWKRTSTIKAPNGMFTEITSLCRDGSCLSVNALVDDDEHSSTTSLGTGHTRNRYLWFWNSRHAYNIQAGKEWLDLPKGILNEYGTYWLSQDSDNLEIFPLTEDTTGKANSFLLPGVNDFRFAGTPNRIAIRQSENWCLYDLLERKDIMFFWSGDWDGHICFSENGEIPISIRNGQLTFSQPDGYYGDFELGFVPADVTHLATDELSGFVFVSTPWKIYRYPLLTNDQILRLAAISGTEQGCSLNGQFVVEAEGRSYLTVYRDVLSHKSVAMAPWRNEWAENWGGTKIYQSCKNDKDYVIRSLSDASDDAVLVTTIPVEKITVKEDGGDGLYRFMLVNRDETKVAIWGRDGEDRDHFACEVFDLQTGGLIQAIPLTSKDDEPFYFDKDTLWMHVDSKIMKYRPSLNGLDIEDTGIYPDAVAVASNESVMAIVKDDVVSLLSFPELNHSASWHLSDRGNHRIAWGLDDQRLFVFGKTAVNICDPTLRDVVLSIPKCERAIVPKRGDTVILGERIWSTTPFRDRWAEIQSVSATESDPIIVRECHRHVTPLLSRVATEPQDSRETWEEHRRREIFGQLNEVTASALQKVVSVRLFNETLKQFDQLKKTHSHNKVRMLTAAKENGSDSGSLDTRELLIETVTQWNPSADDLETAAWKMVVNPGLPSEGYLEAVKLAEQAFAIQPDNGSIANTLGVAHYRVGEYAKCAELLSRSETLIAGKVTFPANLSNLLFIAMAKFQLGETDDARARLEKVRQEQQKSSEPLSDENAAFLKEAEELIKQVPTP